MPNKRPPRRSFPATVHLTVEERDMLLAHCGPDSGFEDVFAAARTHGPLVSVELDDPALDEFLLAFEQTANSAQNIEAVERLGMAFARIGKLPCQVHSFETDSGSAVGLGR